MTLKIAPFAIAIGIIAASPALADTTERARAPSTVYGGSYICKDGEHGVILGIEISERKNSAEHEVSGMLGFFPVLAGGGSGTASVAGSFNVTGTFNDDGRLDLVFKDWMLEPQAYGAANFTGTVSQREDGLWQITGKPLVGPAQDFCSDMLVTQFAP
jgi:hypothetical protein